jgi:hypothetical protein
MKQVFYLLFVLGFTQSFCCSSGMTCSPQNITAYINNDTSESLQNHITLFDAEDFEPDFDGFYQVENLTIYFSYVDTISNYQVKGIIYIRHLILAFISDIPPPCCFML